MQLGCEIHEGIVMGRTCSLDRGEKGNVQNFEEQIS
jgi:hypothetical protein